jgi:hypothetical protein
MLLKIVNAPLFYFEYNILNHSLTLSLSSFLLLVTLSSAATQSQMTAELNSITP